MSHLSVDTLFEFSVVENFVYRARITVILTSDLFRCMSLWLWLCALDDDILLLPVLSVILKVYKYRCLYSCLVILKFSFSNIQKCHICEVYLCFTGVQCWLSQNQSRGRYILTGHVKPEVVIMMYSVASESPRGLLQCHKNSCLTPLLTMRFSAETALAVIPPPRCRNKG